MKILNIDNFKKETYRSVETNNKDFYHQFYSGANFLYKKHSTGDYNQTLADTTFPLLPPLKNNTSFPSFAINSGVTSYTTSKTLNAKGNIFVVLGNSYVTGLSENGVPTGGNFGYPTGSATAENVQTDITSFAGYVIFVSPQVGTPYRRLEDGSDTWASFGAAASFSTPALCEVFNNYLYIGNKPSGSISRLSEIKIFNYSFSFLGTFSIGNEVDIVDFRNINDDYILIVGKKGGEYILYFWDGSPSSSFFKSKKITGEYRGMAVLRGIVYISTRTSDGINIFYLDGFSLVKKAEFNISFYNLSTLVYKCLMCEYNDYMIIPAYVVLESVNNYFLIFYNPFTENTFNIYFPTPNGGTSYSFFPLLRNNTDNIVFSYSYNSNSYLEGKYLENTLSGEIADSGTYYYYSNWIIPENNNSVKIEGIEVYFDSILDASSSINVYLTTIDENERIQLNSFENIKTISSSDGYYKAFVPVKRICSKFKIKLTVTKSSSWSGIVKRINVLYNLVNRAI